MVHALNNQKVFHYRCKLTECDYITVLIRHPSACLHSISITTVSLSKKKVKQKNLHRIIYALYLNTGLYL
jgi:hypothetical protein